MSKNFNVTEVTSFFKDYWPTFDISRKDITTPTSDFIVKFCERFLQEYGIDVYELIPSTAEEFQDIIFFRTLQITVLDLLREMKVSILTDFNLSDLLNPNPKRSKVLFRLVMNILSFNSQFVEDHIQPKEQELQEVKLKLQNSFSKLEDKNEELMLLKANLVDLNNKAKNKTIEKQRLHSSIRELIEDDIHEENKNLYKQSKECDAELQELLKELETIQSENLALEKLVVNNSENLLNKKEKLKTQLSEMEANDLKLQLSNEEKTKMESHYSEVLSKFETIKDDGIIFSELTDELSKLEAKHKVLHQERETNKSHLQELKLNEEKEINIGKQLNDDLENLKIQWNCKQSALIAKKSQLKDEYETLQQKISDEDLETIEMRKKLQVAMEKNEQVKKEADKFEEEVKETYRKLLESGEKVDKAVLKYFNRMLSDANKMKL